MSKKFIFGAIGALVCAACYKTGQVSMGYKVYCIGHSVLADVKSGKRKVTDLSKYEASCLVAVLSDESWKRACMFLRDSKKEGESGGHVNP